MDFANLFYPDSSSSSGPKSVGYYIGDPLGDYAYFSQSGVTVELVHARHESFSEQVQKEFTELHDRMGDVGAAVVEQVAVILGKPWGTELRPRVAGVFFSDALYHLHEYERLSKEYEPWLDALMQEYATGAHSTPTTAALDQAAGTSLRQVLATLRRVCFSCLSCAYAASDAYFFESAELLLQTDQLAERMSDEKLGNPLDRWKWLYRELDLTWPTLNGETMRTARGLLECRNDLTHVKHRRHQDSPRIHRTNVRYLGETRETIRNDFERFPGPQALGAGLYALQDLLLTLGHGAGMDEPM